MATQKNDKTENNEISEYQKINKRKRVQITFTDPSLTQQNLKDEVDINHIVKRYQVTGELPEQKQGIYTDVSEVPDYRQALEIVRVAQEGFNSLPAKVRAEFMNDPGTMIKWLENPQNSARAVELGLIEGDTSTIQPQPPEPKKEENNSQKAQ